MRPYNLVLPLLACSGFAQDMPDPVSATCSGADVKVALEILSTASKVPMSVGNGVQGEIVAFRLKDAPLGTAMKKLAAAVDGQWTFDGKTWTLGPHLGVRDEQARKAIQSRYDFLRKRLTEELQPPKKDPKKKVEEGDEDMEGYTMSPQDLVINRILLNLDLRAIAAMPEDGRIVFATNPNRMQRPMTLNPSLSKLLIEEHNQMVELQKAAGAGTVIEEDGDGKWREWMKRMGFPDEKDKEAIKTPPVKALLVVERGSGMMMGPGNVSCVLKYYDANGKTVLSKRREYSISDWSPARFIEMQLEGGNTEDQPKFDPKSPTIEWSPLAKSLEKFGKVAQTAFMAGGDMKMPDDVKEAMTNPDKFEPLSLVAGHGLIQCAEQSGVQFVASMPDDLFQAGFISNALETKVDRFMYSIERSGAVELVKSEGWWTLKAKEPSEARKTRANRVALGDILRKSQSGKPLRLDDLAAYAVKEKSPGESAIGMGYLMIASPSLMTLMFGGGDWEALRFYGQLTPAQKNLLEGGANISLGSLTPEQTKTFGQMLYGAQPDIQIGAPPAEEAGLPGFMGMSFQMMSRMGEDADYREEPTELCPNGIPGQGFVALKVKTDMLLKPAGGGGMLDYFTSGGIEELAMYQLMRENPAMQGQSFPMPKEVYVGQRRKLDFTFQVGQDAAIRRSMNDDFVAADAKAVAMDKIPPEAKAALDKAVADLKKLNLPFLDPSMFGGGRPPIPPSK